MSLLMLISLFTTMVDHPDTEKYTAIASKHHQKETHHIAPSDAFSGHGTVVVHVIDANSTPVAMFDASGSEDFAFVTIIS